MLTADDYRKLTDPQSVALVGVTSRTGKGSNNPLEVMQEWGYQGKIYPVNPKGGTLLGHTVYTSLLEVPEIPDIAVICAPRDAVPELFGHCCQKKVKLVIITAQGFFDGDAPGRAMQVELIKNAKDHGVRIIGPNTLGVVNNFNRFCTSFMRFVNPIAATGVFSQSGFPVVGAPSLFTGVGILLDIGNATDLEYSEVLGHMVKDPRLKVISMHMESLRDGAAFMSAAREAVKEKPVVIYKTGASPAGAVFASSHTGSLAGEYRVFETAFKQCRLIHVQDVEELKDMNKIFTTFDGIKGKRIGVVSVSGGAGVVAVDAFAKYDLELPALSSFTKERIEEMFPVWASCHNPVDMWPANLFRGFHDVYRRILESFLEDPDIDAVLCITGSFLDPEGDFLDITPMVKELAAKHPDKPIVAWSFGDEYQSYEKKFEEDGNVAYFHSVNRAARALSALYRYHHEIKNAPPHVPTYTAPSQDQTSPVLAGKGAGNLSQTDVFDLLASYNIPVASWAQGATIEEGAAAAERIGYPVVMKVLSRDIVHKTDSGGVKLNIRNSQELHLAYEEMVADITANHPAAAIEGIVIQEYVSGGTEILLGSKRDPQFGPVIVFGTGGIYTEIMEDIALRVPPVSKEDIAEMIRETKVSKILLGARGAKPADMAALTEHIANFARLLLDNPSIAELDINPFVAIGDRFVALDGRVRVG